MCVREPADPAPVRHHDDFYAIATAAEHVLDALFAMNANIGGQLAH